MKEIRYTILPAMGNIETHKHGTVKDLLFDIPYFFSGKDIIPPFAVLNDFLHRGICDAGMSGGCRWNPFELTELEFKDLLEELQTEPTRKLSIVEASNVIKTYDKWVIFRIKFLKANKNNE